MSSFKWETEGGSYAWDTKTEIFLNGIRLNLSGKQNYPVISCPDSPEPSTHKYIIEMKNPQSNSLLRPVSQDE